MAVTGQFREEPVVWGPEVSTRPRTLRAIVELLIEGEVKIERTPNDGWNPGYVNVTAHGTHPVTDVPLLGRDNQTLFFQARTAEEALVLLFRYLKIPAE
mgnify:CR=1 FL=1